LLVILFSFLLDEVAATVAMSKERPLLVSQFVQIICHSILIFGFFGFLFGKFECEHFVKQLPFVEQRTAAVQVLRRLLEPHGAEDPSSTIVEVYFQFHRPPAGNRLDQSYRQYTLPWMLHPAICDQQGKYTGKRLESYPFSIPFYYAVTA
jgi:hypothetical protein